MSAETILAVLGILLGALKEIPETSVIASDISTIENSILNATANFKAAQAKVDPTQLTPETPV